MDYATTTAALLGTGSKVALIILGFVLLGAGGALAVFTGIKMAAPEEPDITITNSQTGQSAKAGRGALVIFIGFGILMMILGIAALVGGFRS
ncbi:MAG TPA: hypothetical protein VE989_03360 [Sphingomicrobium sp.]|nr:hypothetical protein [Sphingomicrobium sp.]